jgi:hypothetical protein
VRQLTHVRSLNLSNNHFTALPDALSELTQLQGLDLSSNEFSTFPEWLGQLTQLRSLDLPRNCLTMLPDSLGQLTQLQWLNLFHNRLTAVPESLGRLTHLQSLDLSSNQLTALPESLGWLTQLQSLNLSSNQLTALPESLGRLAQLQWLNLSYNQLRELPGSLGELTELQSLTLYGNPLNPELAAAQNEGLDAVKRYLRAKAKAQVALNEAKLILIGEGEVGKSCLLGALRGDPWEEGRLTTHGIEIKPVKVTDPGTGIEVTLNGWDFGGQRVYRPTHQLFFSAPAVYLVVWKPREGPQQGFVKEWIKLVKHREPDAKILVVATHGGPKERQPDIDRQEIWDLFGKETVIDFLTVDSKPDEKGERPTIGRLKDAIAHIATSLPEMGRTFPKHWQDARETLRKSNEAYLPLDRVFAICKQHEVEEGDARLLLRICHRVGDLIHYEHDPALCDIVVLKPDWLATAISFVLDDKETRDVRHGLVSFERLGLLWNDPARAEDSRYEANLHPLFVRLMERFDLSYKVAVLDEPKDALGFWQQVKALLAVGKKPGPDVCYTSLIAQLVPDVRPENELARVWPACLSPGDEQQVQICRIVETANNQSATAEGLFFQLIVRLHKYSLGRANFGESVHWQRGLVLEDDTGARAFLEHIGNDVRITVRSPYPARFLAALTYEAQWLVGDFWKGMRCEVTVPCLVPKANGEPCKGLFEVGKLLENKGRGRLEVPCQICNEWQSVEQLLGNAPAARPNPLEELLANFGGMMRMLEGVRSQLDEQHARSGAQQAQIIGRFDRLDAASKEIVSKVESAYSGLMHTLLDEAKEGPRLFSFEPVEPGFLNRPKWISAKFKLTLWCEHSRVPLWRVSGDPKLGVYTLDFPREWLVKAAPFLKILSTTLSLVLPVVASIPKVVLPVDDYKGIEAQLALGKATAESLLKGGEKAGEWLAKDDGLELGPGAAIRAEGGVLRQLHAWLKEKHPTFGGLVRVQNKRQEFLWVHPLFEKEY